MPGTVVRDALAPDLLADVDLADEGAAQNGTAYEIGWAGEVQFVLEIATVTGTTPTMVIDIQGCETSDFTTDDVVTIGTISVADEADASSFATVAYVTSKYVRAVADVSGTTVVYTATLKAVPAHDRQVRGSFPTAKPLA